MPEYAFRYPPEENQEINEKIRKIGKQKRTQVMLYCIVVYFFH